VEKSVIGGFAYSGQVCIHAQRFYVQKSIFEDFVHLFKEKTKQLKFGDPLEPDTDISAMIDEMNAYRVGEWVNEAISGGAKLLHGGNRTGNYYEPTILTNTSESMKVCALEIFGPVVTIEPYSEFNEAVSRVNKSRYGLQAGIFTNRIDEMNDAFTNLNVGGVIINDVPAFRVDHMPYGGVKDSGIGREGVKYAIRSMMVAKILVKNK
ncbi:MAG: aldehyde dehydrogenase family protein, partial [Bacteroidales bacterium]|nr:aldehyde dehydrogenase family protein [Bacteroidales bacterium]